MLTARELYEGVLYELQKEEAPPFGVDTYNHFVGMALEELLREASQGYELTGQMADYLQPLFTIHTFTDQEIANQSFPLPLDYRQLLLCTITLSRKPSVEFVSYGEKIYIVENGIRSHVIGDSLMQYLMNYYYGDNIWRYQQVSYQQLKAIPETTPLAVRYDLGHPVPARALLPLQTYSYQVATRRSSSDMRGVGLSNYYNQPSEREPMHHIKDQYLEIDFGKTSSVTLTGIKIEYLGQAPALTLTEGQVLLGLPDETVRSPFSRTVDIDLIRRTARLFYKNTEDVTRLQLNG